MELQPLIDYLASNAKAERAELIHSRTFERTRYLHVMVEDVYQEHNASAIVRSCDGFGVQEMTILEREHEGKIARGMSKGADKWVDVRRFRSMEKRRDLGLVEEHRQAGRKIVATSPHVDAYTPQNLPIDQPLTILLGREGQGLSPHLLEAADYQLVIPMYGFIESFNVSVSGALILQALVSRIREHGLDWQLSEAERQLLEARWLCKSLRSPERHLANFANRQGQASLVQELKGLLL